LVCLTATGAFDEQGLLGKLEISHKRNRTFDEQGLLGKLEISHKRRYIGNYVANSIDESPSEDNRTQLLKTFTAFYANQNFITMFMRTRHLSPS
jgi:hypothetical protein